MFQRLLGENIAIEVHCGEAPLNVYADPVMIEQIVLNLALNARDAMPDGGRLTIHAAETEVDEVHAQKNSEARAGRFACLSVADTGGGIPQTALPHLFEPFFTTKEPGKGTGLGLATVYGIVQQHKGWIEVENEPAQGAKFCIYIPLGAKMPDRAGETLTRGQIPGGNETILLVEDEPALRRLTRTLLQRSGYRVYDAGSGTEALPVWQQHASEIDLLLTDMIMPDRMSGAGLAKTLRAQKSSLKVIYTTGYSMDALRTDLQLEDGVNFLAKPYSPSRLAQTVRRCLDGPAAENTETVAEAPTQSD
jgi:two-component system cell cycle sensor histidine kinase/response regulator CckA